MTEVLLFVPGLLGSELYDTEGKIWPGSLFQGVVGFDQEHFERLLEPNLTVGGIVQTAGGLIDIYRKWLKAFRSLRVKSKPLFSDAVSPPTLYTAPYDWRLDIASTAQTVIAAAIDRIHADHGGGVSIHIVAHSLGGLLVRHYLQCGKFNDDPSFTRIVTFTTFGTPHNGASVALAGALGLHKTSFMSIEQSQKLANDPRYPSLFQTFPLANEPIFWNRASGGSLTSKSLNDESFVKDVLKLNAGNLAKAFAFREGIDLTEHPLPGSIRYFLIVGTRFDTITHFEYLNNSVSKIETADGGDGTVSIQGGYLPGFQMQFCGESHVDLIESRAAKSTFQRLFNADGLLELFGVGRISLSVRDPTVPEGGDVHLALTMEGAVKAFSGNLTWERAMLKPGATEFVPADFVAIAQPKAVPVDYSGPEAQTMMLKLKAPELSGIYRTVLKRDGLPDEPSSAFVVRS